MALCSVARPTGKRDRVQFHILIKIFFCDKFTLFNFVLLTRRCQLHVLPGRGWSQGRGHLRDLGRRDLGLLDLLLSDEPILLLLRNQGRFKSDLGYQDPDVLKGQPDLDVLTDLAPPGPHGNADVPRGLDRGVLHVLKGHGLLQEVGAAHREPDLGPAEDLDALAEGVRGEEDDPGEVPRRVELKGQLDGPGVALPPHPSLAEGRDVRGAGDLEAVEAVVEDAVVLAAPPLGQVAVLAAEVGQGGRSGEIRRGALVGQNPA